MALRKKAVEKVLKRSLNRRNSVCMMFMDPSGTILCTIFLHLGKIALSAEGNRAEIYVFGA